MKNKPKLKRISLKTIPFGKKPAARVKAPAPADKPPVKAQKSPKKAAKRPKRAPVAKNTQRTQVELVLSDAERTAQEEELRLRLMAETERQRRFDETFDTKTAAVLPKSRPDALYSIESVIYSQIAILERRKNMPDGLEPKEWSRLQGLVKMMKSITDIDLNTTKKSLLEGLSDQEVLALVDEARKALVRE